MLDFGPTRSAVFHNRCHWGHGCWPRFSGILMCVNACRAEAVTMVGSKTHHGRNAWHD